MGWGEKDLVQGNKQATINTLLSLNLGQYKSQDLRVLYIATRIHLYHM